ncbi:hypothetical protein [Sagittula sp. SSi028]|uniref:hypothetical protein n=1 Tax=Sagittula sp. SSi028 TaxID=3400636 RepID=UPI003AF52849
MGEMQSKVDFSCQLTDAPFADARRTDEVKIPMEPDREPCVNSSLQSQNLPIAGHRFCRSGAQRNCHTTNDPQQNHTDRPFVAENADRHTRFAAIGGKSLISRD